MRWLLARLLGKRAPQNDDPPSIQKDNNGLFDVWQFTLPFESRFGMLAVRVTAHGDTVTDIRVLTTPAGTLSASDFRQMEAAARLYAADRIPFGGSS